MQLSLIKSTRIFALTLPHTINGVYWVTDIDEHGASRKLLSIEATEGGCRLNNTKLASAQSLRSNNKWNCYCSWIRNMFNKNSYI